MIPRPLALCLLLAGIASLTACSSEVDKCVESQVDAWQARQRRLQDEVASGKKEAATSPNELGRVIESLEGKVVVDTRSASEVRAEARLKCLEAAPAAR